MPQRNRLRISRDEHSTGRTQPKVGTQSCALKQTKVRFPLTSLSGVLRRAELISLFLGMNISYPLPTAQYPLLL